MEKKFFRKMRKGASERGKREWLAIAHSRSESWIVLVPENQSVRSFNDPDFGSRERVGVADGGARGTVDSTIFGESWRWISGGTLRISFRGNRRLGRMVRIGVGRKGLGESGEVGMLGEAVLSCTGKLRGAGERSE